ncbi:Tab2 family RNA-binding protein [Lyngbya confervoides]|uniref:Tab2/Atab2 family RNA-binding protein n=1 Tax=Lyngbya confervoides BDU141951 TaxID=1574623 RepID=A0ABD4SYD4_9CYAN|nr:Tab2 family RNA-binding protein [Lyngbya confervoides]MCM1981337.1 Tab2/Atab2 family RNA-binding protein [Lyngbya confervoides BDU141951]
MSLIPPPPQPLPESLWGDIWRFVAVSADELEAGLLTKPIPVCGADPALFPSSLALPQRTPIPGVLIEAGRRSLKLSRWIEAQVPTHLASVLADLQGLLLHTHSQQRWILMTYQDAEMSAAARQFEQRKVQSRGLHFLLIQPDDSGVTYSGLWLLRDQRLNRR